MTEQALKIKVFVASPNDVKNERKRVKKAIAELNRAVCPARNICLEFVGWEDVVPDIGKNAQEIIDEQVRGYDIFLGVMWKKFGHPTLGVGSGTEHEFDLAYKNRTKFGKPRILFYFSQKSYTPRTSYETQQWGKVLRFKKKLQKLGLTKDYDNPTDFERLVREHLSKIVLKWTKEPEETARSPARKKKGTKTRPKRARKPGTKTAELMELYLINKAGVLIDYKAPGRRTGVDKKILSGMLTAVTDFIAYSWKKGGKPTSFTTKDFTVLIEQGKDVIVAVVVRGGEVPEIRAVIERYLGDIQETFGAVLPSWSGDVNDLPGIKDIMDDLCEELKTFSGEAKQQKSRSPTRKKKGKKTRPKKKLTTFIPHPYPEAPNFTGRRKERKMLTDWLTADTAHPLLSMVAIGGMGKSALAWRWLQEEVIEKGMALDGAVWWSFYDEKSGFEKFLDYCLEEILKKNPKKFSSTRDKMDAVYQHFQHHPFVLVLDGVERMLRAYAGLGSPYQGDEVKKNEKKDFDRCVDPNFGFLLQWLASDTTKSKTLVTTRIHPHELEDLKGAETKSLKRMAKEDAVQYFRNEKLKGTRAEFEAAGRAYGFHPLCLRLLAGMVKKDKKSPGNISLWIKKNPLSKLTGEKKKHHILQLAYDALDGEQQKMIGRIAAFRSAQDFETLKVFFTIVKDEEKEEKLQVMIDDFERRGLLLHIHDERRNLEKYDMHPIIRRYCYDRLTNPKKTHELLRMYFEATPPLVKVEKLEDLNPVIELYHHTVGAGRYNASLLLLYERLIPNPLYYQFGAYNLCIELKLALFPDGEAKPPRLKEISHQGIIIDGLANCYSLSGQPIKAIPHFIKSVKIDEKLDKKEGVAISLINLVDDQLKIGDLGSAESNLRRAIDICQEIGDEHNEAIGRKELGRILLYHGAFEKSETEQARAIELYEKESHSQGIGISWSYLSLRALLMDKPTEARESAEKALEFAKKDAEDDYPVVRDFIRARWLLGTAHLGLNEPKKAEPHLNFAITECRKINLVELEADILLSLAKLRHLLKQDDESLKLTEEALEIAKRCGYVFQQADIHLFFGEFWRDKGELERAKEHAGKAKLRSHQMIDVETGDYITKPEDTKWKYKPCYDKAVKLLEKLGVKVPKPKSTKKRAKKKKKGDFQTGYA